MDSEKGLSSESQPTYVNKTQAKKLLDGLAELDSESVRGDIRGQLQRLIAALGEKDQPEVDALAEDSTFLQQVIVSRFIPYFWALLMRVKQRSHIAISDAIEQGQHPISAIIDDTLYLASKVNEVTDYEEVNPHLFLFYELVRDELGERGIVVRELGDRLFHNARVGTFLMFTAVTPLATLYEHKYGHPMPVEILEKSLNLKALLPTLAIVRQLNANTVQPLELVAFNSPYNLHRFQTGRKLPRSDEMNFEIDPQHCALTEFIPGTYSVVYNQKFLTEVGIHKLSNPIPKAHLVAAGCPAHAVSVDDLVEVQPRLDVPSVWTEFVEKHISQLKQFWLPWYAQEHGMQYTPSDPL